MRMNIAKREQTGAALLVSLIILLILSIIGISAMRGGLLQLLMSANSQQSEMAFSAADAGVSAVVYNASEEGIVGSILGGATTTPHQATTYSVDNEGAVAALDDDDDAPNFDSNRDTPITVVTADVTYRDCPFKCPGYSIKEGTGSNFCHAFEVNSTGAVADAEANVDQWISAIAAPCES